MVLTPHLIMELILEQHLGAGRLDASHDAQLLCIDNFTGGSCHSSNTSNSPTVELAVGAQSIVTASQPKTVIIAVNQQLLEACVK